MVITSFTTLGNGISNYTCLLYTSVLFLLIVFGLVRGCRMGRKACAGAGRTACRCSGTALAVGRLAVMALLVRAHRIGDVYKRQG